MITADYARTMARYGAWQNESLATAADGLDETGRQAPRGAFFGSIAGTLNHLLWGDRIWLARFTDGNGPGGGIGDSPRLTPDWAAYRAGRAETDAALIAWTDGLDDAALAGRLTWFSGAAGREISKPTAFLVMHLFTHAAHHRGQTHAMLTAAGARPEPTDLFLWNGAPD